MNAITNQATVCVHSGTHLDLVTGGVNSPIFPSTAAGYLDGTLYYPRYYNTPNQQAVVEKLCALEYAEDGIVTSSGMAAIASIFTALLRTGDHVVFQPELYGGTHFYVSEQFSRLGVDYTYAPTSSPADIATAITPATKIIYIETPSNPLLTITDIAAIADLARKRGIITVIDNTFASPILQNPILLGIDVILHSGTKYLNGHSDMICGAVVGTKHHIEAVRKAAVVLGGTLNAPDCALLERSMKTLAIRVERQSTNAMRIAEELYSTEGISKVLYPGLSTHPAHDIASKQMQGFGGMLSFELADSSATDFQRALRLIAPAASLGGVETTICSPAMTSHAKISQSERDKAGISDRLLRLSVGIEDYRDIIADIKAALVQKK